MFIKRGDIYYVDGGSTVGSEQSGNRPAVIVSNDTGNKYAPVVEVVYLTTQRKNNLPTHVNISSVWRYSTALCEQIVTVSKSRLQQYVGSVTESEMKQIDVALQTSLGINESTRGNEMQITIKTVNGDMNFDMPQNRAMEIIQKAFQYSGEQENKSKEPQQEIKHEVKQIVSKTKPVVKPHRRVDSLFGDFRSNIPKTEAIENKREYKGFLILKCRECGRIRSFCTKSAISESICECGCKTELRNLTPVYVNCKCGSRFKYLTNITDESFEYSCLNCGSPVDLKLNGRRNAYVTMTD